MSEGKERISVGEGVVKNKNKIESIENKKERALNIGGRVCVCVGSATKRQTGGGKKGIKEKKKRQCVCPFCIGKKSVSVRVCVYVLCVGDVCVVCVRCL